MGDDPARALLALALRTTGARAGLLAVQAGAALWPVAFEGPLDVDAAADLLGGAGESGELLSFLIGDPAAPKGHLVLDAPNPTMLGDVVGELCALALGLLGHGRSMAACPVTELLQGEAALAQIQRVLARSKGDQQHALLIGDIADFNAINSAFGRSNGDRILGLAADRIRQLVPSHALAFRVQGDVFGVFLEVEDRAAELEGLVATLTTGFDEPILLDDQEVILHLVFGSAVFPHRASNASELFDRALLALRRAQEQRSVAEVFTTELEERLVREVALEQRLRAALAEQRLTVFYQPKVRLASRAMYAVEALCRWTDSELGFVSPGEFIPAAERAGVVSELGRQVLRQSIVDVARMRGVLPQVSVSVNVAAEQLTRADFVDEVVEELQRAGVHPSALELELTESSVIENLDQAVEVIERLAQAGVPCSIDDFGTGYSSLAYLRQLPAKTLKLDRSFLANVCDSERDANLVRSIVSMAHVLGFEVVAEGIEEEFQARLLLELGCDAGQGFLFARPSPIERVLRLLDGSA